MTVASSWWTASGPVPTVTSSVSATGGEEASKSGTATALPAAWKAAVLTVAACAALRAAWRAATPFEPVTAAVLVDDSASAEAEGASHAQARSPA